MAINLQKGQRISLEKSITHALIGLGWDTNKYDGGADFDLDASVFLLGENDRLIRDEDFVFYNNLSGRDGAVVHMGDNLTGGSDGDDEQIRIDFTKLPPEIKKIAICVTIYAADLRRQNFGQVSNAYIKSPSARNHKGFSAGSYKDMTRVAWLNPTMWTQLFLENKDNLEEEFSIETALVVAEIYNKNGEWKFNAVAAGYQGGLAAICRSFGANV